MRHYLLITWTLRHVGQTGTSRPCFTGVCVCVWREEGEGKREGEGEREKEREGEERGGRGMKEEGESGRGWEN